MNTLLQHLDNCAEVSVAVSWHGQDDQIGVLEAIRSAVIDVRRPNNSACECAPEHIDPRITCADVVSGGENGNRATCVGYARIGRNYEHGTR